MSTALLVVVIALFSSTIIAHAQSLDFQSMCAAQARRDGPSIPDLLRRTSPFLFRDRERLGEFTLQHRTASVFAFREWVDAGGLLSYGPSVIGMFRGAAEYVDRIARGARPSELPIEQPTKFEFVLNLKTAKAIDLETSHTTPVSRSDLVHWHDSDAAQCPLSIRYQVLRGVKEPGPNFSTNFWKRLFVGSARGRRLHCGRSHPIESLTRTAP